MLVETFPVGMLACNCTIVACERTREAIVVDPGGDAPRILDFVKANGLAVRRVIHTHAHFDHVLGTKEVHDATGARVGLHPGDAFLYDNLAMQASWLGLTVRERAPAVSDALDDGQTLAFGDDAALVIHTPGHTPGSCCFSLRTREGMLLLSGDTLFRGSIGRTDLPGGDSERIMESLRSRILPLDDDTRVIPGHGPETRIGFERKKNPFLTGAITL